MASLSFLFPLSNYWYGLSDGTREGIVSGLVVALVLGAATLFRKSLLAVLRRLVGSNAPPPQAQHSPQELTIKVENVPTAAPLPPRVPTAAPAVPTPEIPRTPAVEFVARRDKDGKDILTLLKERLAPNNHQLIVLWGPGGVGKTRLANEAAHALRESFDSRIVWVSADGRPDFGLATLLDGIATQMNHVELRQLAPELKREQVRKLISSAPPLVILDNFETILPQEQEGCSSFLAQEASCPALITTRGMIASNFVHNIPIDAMSQDEARQFLKELIAQVPNPEAFTDRNLERIIQVSTANPLVMQWVVQQIALSQEPEAVLGQVSHGEGDAAGRVFDNSFELPYLGDDGRAVLLALSLFSLSASRPLLAEVAGFGEDVGRFNLAAKSLGALRLVKTAENGKRLMVEGLSRELTKARLAKDKRVEEEFRKRFVASFLGYSEAHAEPTPEDYDSLETERDNLLSAMDMAFALNSWADVVRLMGAINFDGVNGYLTTRGYWDEVIRKGEQALQAARNLTDESLIAGISHNLAITYQIRGKFDEARRLYNESLEIKKRLGNQRGIASSLHQLARLAHDQGERDEARRLYNESLKIEEKLGNQGGIAISLHQLARLAHDQGERDEARRLYNESLEIEKRLGNQSGIAHSLHNLATLAYDQGELDEARRLCNESLEISKRLGDQRGIASTLGQLGNLAEDEGSDAEAVQLFSEALAIFEKLKSPNAEMARRSLGRVKDKFIRLGW